MKKFLLILTAIFITMLFLIERASASWYNPFTWGQNSEQYLEPKFGASVLFPYQGGTGIGSATAGQVGTCIKVSDDSPFTYELGTCGTGSGSGSGGAHSTSTAWGTTLYVRPNNATDIYALGYDGTGVASSTNEAEYVADPVAKLAYYINGMKLGIGTTSPYTALSVVGEVVASNFTATGSTASIFPLANITKLSNLTSNGFVKTSGGDGTLSVDTTTYESGLTAGDGLTRTANDFDCDTASGSVFGCLSSADWTTFNNKVPTSITLTAGNGLTGGGDLSTNRTFDVAVDSTLSVSADSLGINLANANTWTGLQKLFGAASSTLFSANEAWFGGTATTSITNAGELGINDLTPDGWLDVNDKLVVSKTGFGTTTLAGLDIVGSATSTSNVGFNITNGCYAIGGTCISGGGSGDITSVGDVASGAAFDGTQGTTLTFNSAGGDGTLVYDADGYFKLDKPLSVGLVGSGLYFDNTGAFASYSKNRFGFGTTTPFVNYQMTVASSTAPQLSLSAGAGLSQWTMRNAGGNLYFATTTVAGTATSSTSSLELKNSGTGLGIATSTFSSSVLGLGTNGSTNGTSTIAAGKLQFDGYNTAGSRICMYVVGTTLTIGSGACNQ